MTAIRELRTALGENQVQFAVRIGKSYPSVQRYERNTPPAGKELVPFVHIARECGRLDLARIFKQGIIDSIPPEMMKVIQEPGPEDEPATQEASKESPVHKRRVRA